MAGLLDPLFYGGYQGDPAYGQGLPQEAMLSDLFRRLGGQPPAQAQTQAPPSAPVQAPPMPRGDVPVQQRIGDFFAGLSGKAAPDRQAQADQRAQQEQQRNQSIDFLVNQGHFDKGTAAALMQGDPDVRKAVLAGVFKKPGSGSGEYSKNPIYGQDKDGNTVVLQAGTAGDVVASKMPEGVTVNAKPIMMDLGDKFAVLDPVTRAVVGYHPKGIAEVQRQQELGTAQGKAQGALPLVENSSRTLIQAIDDALGDESLDSVTGMVGGRIPKSLHTPGMARAQSRLDQIQGKTFLQAFNDLRGGGAITEKESAGAVAAYNRLTAQTMGSPDYKAALKEFRDEVVKLSEIARQRASGGASPDAPRVGKTASGITWELE